MQTRTLGFMSIGIGLIMILYTIFDYAMHEKVVSGNIINKIFEKNQAVQYPPVIGVILLLGGIVVMVSSRKANA